jgi:V/A-type H+-transporting ATPase subunit A
LILTYYRLAEEALGKGAALEALLNLPVKERIARAKLIPEDTIEDFDKIREELASEIGQAAAGRQP